VTILKLLILWAVVVNVVLYFAGFRRGRSAGRAAGAGVSRNRAGTSPSGGGSGSAKRILVIGATGGTGRQLVLRGLERGYHVTAFVRDPARLGIEHERLAVARGDVLDSSTVEAAIHGHDAVLSALGHRSYYSMKGILTAGTANMIRAMEKHGVRRLICETSLGIGDSVGRLGPLYLLFITPVVLPLYFIGASGLEWVIVRPTGLTDQPPGGIVRHGRGAVDFLIPSRVSRADVADFMLNQIESDDHLYTAPGVS
jgi:putative NADH-flavin reductase